MIEIEVGGKSFPAYFQRPSGTPKGGLIVVHEVWGLTDHIRDVSDRFVREGYVVVAPDLLSETGISALPLGKLQEELFDPARRAEAQPKLRELMAPLHAPGFADETTAKVRACFEYLLRTDGVEGRIAIVGFCFGGSYSFSLAVNEPRLRAAVPFYGHADFSAEQLKHISCPVQAFYGENDHNLIGTLEDLKAKMAAAKVDFTATVYEGCGHAFFNDTNRFSYNEPAASDAWRVANEFLARNLT